MASKIGLKNTPPPDDSLLLYSELDAAQVRGVQRRLKKGELHQVAKGIVSSRAEADWPTLIARDRIRVLAALFPGALYGYRTAFDGGRPEAEVVYLNYTYPRTVELPGLTIVSLKGAAPQTGDMVMQGKNLYFPSEARLLLENLTQSRGALRKSVGKDAVERRLLDINDSRGEESLSRLRESARSLAPLLGLDKEFKVLDTLVGSILGTRPSELTTMAGKPATLSSGRSYSSVCSRRLRVSLPSGRAGNPGMHRQKSSLARPTTPPKVGLGTGAT